MGDLTHRGEGTTGLASAASAASDPGSPAASQGEALHSRGQGRAAPGSQRLELRVEGLEVPDLEVGALADEHDRPRDAREVAQLGRDEQPAGGVELVLLREAHEEALPEARLAVEARERHHLRANG